MRTENQSEDFGQNRKQQNRKRIRAENRKESRFAEKSEASQSGRLKEKRADLSENRGDSRSKKNGGSKKPKQKQRLKFAYEETGASVKNDKDMEKLNQMDTDGVRQLDRQINTLFYDRLLASRDKNCLLYTSIG